MLEHGGKVRSNIRSQRILRSLVLSNFGLAEAVLQDGNRVRKPQVLMPVPSSSLLNSPWKMRRDELVAELESYQVAVHPRWTVPEVRQTVVEQRAIRFPKVTSDPCAGLTKMKLEELIAKAREFNVVLPEKPTRGVLIKLIRDQAQPPGQHVMTFGKYRSWLYQETPEDYMNWAVREVQANPNSGADLRMYATWAKMELEQRRERAKKGGIIAAVDDPEVRAVVEPPDVSVMSWKSSISSAAQSNRKWAPGREKRHLPGEQELDEVRAMMPELTEDEKNELQELETKVASIRQKYQLPPRGPAQ